MTTFYESVKVEKKTRKEVKVKKSSFGSYLYLCSCLYLVLLVLKVLMIMADKPVG